MHQYRRATPSNRALRYCTTVDPRPPFRVESYSPESTAPRPAVAPRTVPPMTPDLPYLSDVPDALADREQWVIEGEAFVSSQSETGSAERIFSDDDCAS